MLVKLEALLLIDILLLMMLLTMPSKDHIPLKWTEQLWIKSVVVVKGNILTELNRPDQGIWELFLYLTETSFIVIASNVLI